MRLKTHHVIVIAASMMVIGTLISLVSLDAKANRHVELINTQTDSQIVLPLEIPATQDDTATTHGNTVETESITADQSEWINTEVKRGDSLAVIFKRHQLNAGELHAIMQLGDETSSLRALLPGQTFRIQIDQDRSIQTLVYDINQYETLSVHRDGDNFVSKYHHKNVEKRTNNATAVINSSLFESGREAGLSDKLTMELAHIFGWDIDFALDIRQGDHFTVLYEEHFLNGAKVDDGEILAAEFVNQGQSYHAIRYTDASGRSDYYSPDGMSMRKAFLRTPVDFRRISSRFGNRKHPILSGMRMHKGVDYSAPTGTPIQSSGDGKVIFKGTKGGYGRTIIIQHGGRYSTLYAHMSSYRNGVNVGKRVKQGQVIGYVGASGRATGPHLHYEFRVNGVHTNPLTVKLPNALPIDDQYKDAFVQHAETMLSQLAMFKETSLALNHH
jgi:murein DD-endopeptidase MepM/ murein hydrolase activator NlpD